MKTTKPAILILLTLLIPALVAPAEASDWTQLGVRHVNDRVDRDTLRVGARKGTFDAIRLEVKGHAVEFRDLKIHFENGDVQDVKVRRLIRAGQSTRAIDLQGGKRVIEKIVFLYDAQTRRRGKGARVKAFGRK